MKFVMLHIYSDSTNNDMYIVAASLSENMQN